MLMAFKYTVYKNSITNPLGLINPATKAFCKPIGRKGDLVLLFLTTR
jgi:hypothetical protein